MTFRDLLEAASPAKILEAEELLKKLYDAAGKELPARFRHGPQHYELTSNGGYDFRIRAIGERGQGLVVDDTVVKATLGMKVSDLNKILEKVGVKRRGFRDYNSGSMNESKKVTGIKGTLGRYDKFYGTLKIEIAVETEDEALADETYTQTSVYFEGNTWSMKNINISDKLSHSKFKKAVTKAIEEMLGSRDLMFYFKEDDDEYTARKDATYEIWLDADTIK